MDHEAIDDLMTPPNASYVEHPDQHNEHYIEQYRIYMHIFNSTADHRHKSNEFFLGLNTAIMGIMGYLETKSLSNSSIIFTLVPLVGIAICFCWYRLIMSFTHLNRAKFKIIHALEKKLPVVLFDTEWKLLGAGNRRKYRPFSDIERFIPIIFIVLYLVILFSNSPLVKLFT